jgi:2',3'-cyclic-nucleotide 2'-phosphodiesterase (5'-nucleotidase family)
LNATHCHASRQSIGTPVPKKSSVLELSTVILIVLGVLCWVSLALCTQSFGQGPFKATILYINDPHAHYLPYQAKNQPGLIGGFARAATLIRRISSENQAQGRETLVLLAGDLLTGTPFSMVWKGEVGVRLLDRMALTAMTVGNHEFDHGTQNVVRHLKPLMNFPLLSANIIDERGERLFDASLVKDYASSNTRVFIFGLTTVDTPITTHPGNVVGLRFLDPIKTAKELLSQSRKGDLVVALTHLGVEEDKRLAASCPRINVIVGGHSHTALFQPLRVGDTLIVQAGAYTQYLGRLDLEFSDGRIEKYSGELIPLTEGTPGDPEISAIVDEYKAKLDARFSEVIGRTDIFLDGTRSSVRSDRPSNLAKLVVYTMAKAVNAQAALLNGGAIRSSIFEGDITLTDVYTAFPFSDRIVKMDLKGKDLLAVLQRSLDLPDGSGGKLQTFGVSYEIVNGQTSITKVGDAEFRPEDTYSIATNDFLAEGGDGYDLLKERGSHVYASSTLITDPLIELIREKRVIDATVIKRLN